MAVCCLSVAGNPGINIMQQMMADMGMQERLDPGKPLRDPQSLISLNNYRLDATRLLCMLSIVQHKVIKNNAVHF